MILKRDKLAQFCTNIETISSDVTTALEKIYKEKPRYGWIRAEKYEILKKDYDRLSFRFDELVKPSDISDLGTLDQKINITGYIESPNNPWHRTTSLKKIFLIVGENIFRAYPENTLFLQISKNIEFPNEIPEYLITVDNKSKRDIRNKLKKHNLITYTDMRIEMRTIFMWEITKKGKYYFNNEDNL